MPFDQNCSHYDTETSPKYLENCYKKMKNDDREFLKNHLELLTDEIGEVLLEVEISESLRNMVGDPSRVSHDETTDSSSGIELTIQHRQPVSILNVNNTPGITNNLKYTDIENEDRSNDTVKEQTSNKEPKQFSKKRSSETPNVSLEVMAQYGPSAEILTGVQAVVQASPFNITSKYDKINSKEKYSKEKYSERCLPRKEAIEMDVETIDASFLHSDKQPKNHREKNIFVTPTQDKVSCIKKENENKTRLLNAERGNGRNNILKLDCSIETALEYHKEHNCDESGVIKTNKESLDNTQKCNEIKQYTTLMGGRVTKEQVYRAPVEHHIGNAHFCEKCHRKVEKLKRYAGGFCKSDENEISCLCEHCGVVRLISESEKHPITDYIITGSDVDNRTWRNAKRTSGAPPITEIPNKFNFRRGNTRQSTGSGISSSSRTQPLSRKKSIGRPSTSGSMKNDKYGILKKNLHFSVISSMYEKILELELKVNAQEEKIKARENIKRIIKTYLINDLKRHQTPGLHHSISKDTRDAGIQVDKTMCNGTDSSSTESDCLNVSTHIATTELMNELKSDDTLGDKHAVEAIKELHGRLSETKEFGFMQPDQKKDVAVLVSVPELIINSDDINVNYLKNSIKNHTRSVMLDIIKGLSLSEKQNVTNSNLIKDPYMRKKIIPTLLKSLIRINDSVETSDVEKRRENVDSANLNTDYLDNFQILTAIETKEAEKKVDEEEKGNRNISTTMTEMWFWGNEIIEPGFDLKKAIEALIENKLKQKERPRLKDQTTQITYGYLKVPKTANIGVQRQQLTKSGKKIVKKKDQSTEILYHYLKVPQTQISRIFLSEPEKSFVKQKDQATEISYQHLKTSRPNVQLTELEKNLVKENGARKSADEFDKHKNEQVIEETHIENLKYGKNSLSEMFIAKTPDSFFDNKMIVNPIITDANKLEANATLDNLTSKERNMSRKISTLFSSSHSKKKSEGAEKIENKPSTLKLKFHKSLIPKFIFSSKKKKDKNVIDASEKNLLDTKNLEKSLQEAISLEKKLKEALSLERDLQEAKDLKVTYLNPKAVNKVANENKCPEVWEKNVNKNEQNPQTSTLKNESTEYQVQDSAVISPFEYISQINDALNKAANKRRSPRSHSLMPSYYQFNKTNQCSKQESKDNKKQKNNQTSPVLPQNNKQKVVTLSKDRKCSPKRLKQLSTGIAQDESMRSKLVEYLVNPTNKEDENALIWDEIVKAVKNEDETKNVNLKTTNKGTRKKTIELVHSPIEMTLSELVAVMNKPDICRSKEPVEPDTAEDCSVDFQNKRIEELQTQIKLRSKQKYKH